MSLELFDTNNWARIRFESDGSGLPLRACIFEAFHKPPAVFFFDGFNAKALRKAKYSLYKEGRIRGPDNFYVMLGFFQELLLYTHHVVVEVPGYEADDVIATFCKVNPDTEIDIFSTDRDFCALHRPGLRTPMANLKGVTDPADVRLHKTLCGDKSDNIPGIKGFGQKSWEYLDDRHKANWHRHFSGRPFIDVGYLGLIKSSHVAFWETQQDLLQTFWDIVGFYDVPMDLIEKHTKVGKKDWGMIEKKLKELLQ